MLYMRKQQMLMLSFLLQMVECIRNMLLLSMLVKVDPINFTATAKEKAPNAWNGNTASIYCQTPGTTNTTQIIGDLNELFVGGKSSGSIIPAHLMLRSSRAS